MKDERLRVLQMVEDGKISVDEATKLLDALKASADEQYYAGPDFQDKMKDFSRNVESFAKEFGGKMEGKFKEMEPKIKKATKVVVEKTAGLVDEISKALNESLKNFEHGDCCEDDEDDCDCGCCCGEDDNTTNGEN